MPWLYAVSMLLGRCLWVLLQQCGLHAATLAHVCFSSMVHAAMHKHQAQLMACLLLCAWCHLKAKGVPGWPAWDSCTSYHTHLHEP